MTSKNPISTKTMLTTMLLVAILVSMGVFSSMCIDRVEKKGDSKEEVSIDNEVVVTIFGPDGRNVTVTYGEIMGLAQHSETGTVQNRFGNWGVVGTYNGVKLADIVDMSGGMDYGDTLKVESSDGYAQIFSYHNVYPDDFWIEYQGNPLLAFGLDGTNYPDWDEGPKLIMIPPDGEFSNDDCNWTSAVGQGYFLNPSAGARWVRNVESIEIIPKVADEWFIKITGEATKNLSRTEYLMFNQWYGRTVSDDKENNYTGVPLWHFLGLVDDGQRHFNETLSNEGYHVFLFDDVGNRVDFSSNYTAKNHNILLVSHINGESVLDTLGWPLVLMDVKNGSLVLHGNVASIIIEPPDILFM